LNAFGVHMYTMSELSSQRAAVLAFLRERVGQGAPPSLAEIAAHCRFASRTAAQKHVQALAHPLAQEGQYRCTLGGQF